MASAVAVLNRLDALNEAIVKILAEIAVERDLSTLFKRFADLLRCVFHFDLVSFAVDDLDRQAMVINIVEKQRLFCQTLPVHASFQRWIATPRLVASRELPSDLHSLKGHGIQSYCSFPLSTAHRAVGAIGLGDKNSGAYAQDDLDCLRPVATEVAFAVSENLTHRGSEKSGARTQEAEELRLQLERSPDYAVGMLDREGRVLTWNTGAQRLAGYRPEEVIGHYFTEFLTPKLVTELKADLDTAVENGGSETQHWIVRKDGARVWTDRVITALRDGSGQVGRFLVVSRDFTQRKVAEEALVVGMSDAVGANCDVQQLVSLVSASIRGLTPHDDVFIGKYEPQSGEIQIIGVSPGLKVKPEEFTVPLEGTPAGLAFRSGRAVSTDLDTGRCERPEVASLLRSGVKSCYWVPLISDEKAIGVLGLTSASHGAFVNINPALLTHVVNLVTLAINSVPTGLLRTQEGLGAEGATKYEFGEIVHSSVVLQRILLEVETVAPTDATVLIIGETGTGKELIARAIHSLSGRRGHAFVKLNCAAIPGGLLESELFGHEKGAFTGAICQKLGRMESANHGTLFLDEVGDIPLELQPKLLRALQEREFERLGSTRTINVDVRLVAATNQDLEEMVKARKFRSDLYYRLKVFPVTLPALRDRPDDIPPLVEHFTRKHARRMGKAVEIIPPEAMEALKRWHWPGNVRELENFIERAVVLSKGRVLEVPITEIRAARSAELDQCAAPSTLKDAERETIICALRRTRGVIGGPNGAAAQLGLKRTTLNFKMRKLGITREMLWSAKTTPP
jgi:PAS domain S-box-containing protein